MKIAICDDEKIFIEKVYECVKVSAKKHGRECSIQTFDNGDALIEACMKYNFDAIFLDIAMPRINGFETAKELMKIKNEITLIFVSSKETLVYSSYEYKPFWFVPKSQLSLLESVAEKVMEKIENEEIENRLISVQIEKNRIFHINLKEDLYIKSEGHYLNIYMQNGDVSASFRNNLNHLQKQLEQYGFIRCHERYLINCRMISCIEGYECILLNKERIPVSRRKMIETKKLFQEYLRRLPS